VENSTERLHFLNIYSFQLHYYNRSKKKKKIWNKGIAPDVGRIIEQTQAKKLVTTILNNNQWSINQNKCTKNLVTSNSLT